MSDFAGPWRSVGTHLTRGRATRRRSAATPLRRASGRGLFRCRAAPASCRSRPPPIGATPVQDTAIFVISTSDPGNLTMPKIVVLTGNGIRPAQVGDIALAEGIHTTAARTPHGWTSACSSPATPSGPIERRSPPSAPSRSVCAHTTHTTRPGVPRLGRARIIRVFEIHAIEAAYRAHAEYEHVQRLGFGLAIPLLESREWAFFETIEPLSPHRR